MATDKLLVTTSLEDTWGDKEEIIFLGEWCQTFGNRHVWSTRIHETIPFHWDDRGKLKFDYNYLEVLHHQLLKDLAVSLNEYHNVEYSERYWQILLDGWLLTYIGVLFDRWECLRCAFSLYGELSSVALAGYSDLLPPLSYIEFITQAVSDEWNHAVYMRILEYQYPNSCVIKENEARLNLENQGKNNEKMVKPRPTLRSKILNGVTKLLGKFCTQYNTVFVGSYFNTFSLVRLNLALRQVPRLLYDFTLSAESLDALQESMEKPLDRTSINLNFLPKSDFEGFLKKSLPFDLPLCVVEGYHSLRKQVICQPIKTKIIVTAHSHWSDFVAKAWFAEQVALGTKLVILEHGGSFPAEKELFDYEEDISDARGTWFLPYHSKHRQVPPSRLIGRFPKGFSVKRHLEGKYCSIIGNECPRWGVRVHFYPIGSQCLDSVDLIKQLYDELREHVKERIRVKPAPDCGWNTRDIYASRLGEDMLYPQLSIDNVFSQSRLVICTYPETTFTEAMASGVPTVMIYPEHYYERHLVAIPLLELLRRAKIIFHDPYAAAVHINMIWADPLKWWSSLDIIAVREEFSRQACKLNSNWLKEWKIFLSEV